MIGARAREISPVLEVLQKQRGSVTNRRLAELADLSEATAHREVKKLCAAGIVIKERAGRSQEIRLA